MTEAEKLERAIREHLDGDGRLPCAVALDLARTLKIPSLEVGRAADRLGIKITNCQLGCFGKK